ncbi:interleukin-7 [Orycteropus afer afer]|uniref:Interleukin-7 n=1 Tax=Orycteropus afer afer TaxID=1230840 RepID=A0A8B7A9W4_ORYAF|nr:interleukin-7 [Orycteropus afer afer]
MTTPASRRPCSMVSALASPGAQVRAPGTQGDSGTRCLPPRPGASGNSPALHFGPAENTGSFTRSRQLLLSTVAHSYLLPELQSLAVCETVSDACFLFRERALQPSLRSAVAACSQVAWVASASVSPSLSAPSQRCPLSTRRPTRPASDSVRAKLLTGARGSATYSYLMLNLVSFRYIFGIPPLILVLLPVASSDCDIEGKEGNEYEKVLMISINGLDNMLEIGTSCPTNESNFFKKHSCDDNKEAMFLYRAARRVKQFLKMNISEDFNLHLSIVSKGTLKLLNCTSKDKERKAPSLGEAQPTKNLEENKFLKEQRKQNDLCFLKRLLEKIKTCWNKILNGAKDP